MADPTTTRKIEVVDLRGAGSPPAPAVLVDPTGRRARLLGRGGRVVGLVFVAWFCCLVLAGLGLLPAGGIPLGSSVTPSQPRGLARIPAPRRPSRADLRPATPLRAATLPAGTRATGGSAGHRVAAGGTPATRKGLASPKKARTPVPSALAPKAATSPIVASTHGSSATSPGHSTTTVAAPGHSGTAPGATNNPHTATTTTTTTASPGNSGSAPGQTRTSTTGHGPPA